MMELKEECRRTFKAEEGKYWLFVLCHRGKKGVMT